MSALLAACSERRRPRAAATLLLIATGTIVAARLNRSGGSRIGEIPHAFVRVAGLVPKSM